MEKRRSIIFGLLIAVSSLLTFGCDSGGSDGGGTGYAIGDTGPSGVGIVFYVTDGGLHGLEAAPVNQSNGTSWSNMDESLIGTTETAIGTGSANTDAIIAQTGHNASAAQICRDYRSTEEGDWFLPSRDELNLMYVNLHQTGVGGFDGNYWSSSELNGSIVLAKNFFTGSEHNILKSDGMRVRAIRAF